MDELDRLELLTLIQRLSGECYTDGLLHRAFCQTAQAKEAMSAVKAALDRIINREKA